MPSTSGSTVLFMAFPSPDSSGLIAWAHFRDLVARGMSAAEQGESARERQLERAWAAQHHLGIWRMLASNHREVARSAHAYPSFESARLAVTELQSTPASLEIRSFHGPSSSTHGWAALSEGRPVFTCARWYETESASSEAGALSVAAFRSAAVADSPWQRAERARQARRAV